MLAACLVKGRVPIPTIAVVRVTLGLTLSLLAATALAPVALGECSAFDRPPDRTLNVGYAFMATVVEASGDVDPPRRDNADYTWHVELRIDRVYAGDVPKQLIFNGWSVGCHSIRGNKLNMGDRILVAVEDLNLRHLPGEPVSGDTVVWRRAEGQWHYARKVVGSPESPADEFLSPAILGARTTSDILAIVDSAAPPDTSTDDEPDLLMSTRSPTNAAMWTWVVLAGSFVVGLVAFLRGRRAPIR
jgi:hypothetical protein